MALTSSAARFRSSVEWAITSTPARPALAARAAVNVCVNTGTPVSVSLCNKCRERWLVHARGVHTRAIAPAISERLDGVRLVAGCQVLDVGSRRVRGIDPTSSRLIAPFSTMPTGSAHPRHET